jgi:hypothetical protein
MGANLSPSHRLARGHSMPLSADPVTADRSRALPARVARSYARFCAGARRHRSVRGPARAARAGPPPRSTPGAAIRRSSRHQVGTADAASASWREQSSMWSPMLELPDRTIRIRREDTIVMTEERRGNATSSKDTRTPRPRAGVVRMKRRGGSRGRTAWPRPREPGTAGYCGPASGLDARRVKRVAHPASANTIARFGPCAKHACGPSSPTSTRD